MKNGLSGAMPDKDVEVLQALANNAWSKFSLLDKDETHAQAQWWLGHARAFEIAMKMLGERNA